MRSQKFAEHRVVGHLLIWRIVAAAKAPFLEAFVYEKTLSTIDWRIGGMMDVSETYQRWHGKVTALESPSR
jgi:hypothetical protein